MYIKHHSSDVTCHINAVPAGSPSHTWRWNPWFPKNGEMGRASDVPLSCSSSRWPLWWGIPWYTQFRQAHSIDPWLFGSNISNIPFNSNWNTLNHCFPQKNLAHVNFVRFKTAPYPQPRVISRFTFLMATAKHGWQGKKSESSPTEKVIEPFNIPSGYLT
jgi:hypothetical protein